MKILKPIIRVSLLLLIVLLGLTVVFPEWLDLKDMMIAEYAHDKPKVSTKPVESSKLMEFINHATQLPGRALSAINQKVLGAIMVDEYQKFGPALLALYPLWILLAVAMYLMFIALFAGLYLFLSDYMVKRLDDLVFTEKYMLFAKPLLLVISFALALLIWPILVAIVVKGSVFVLRGG